MSTESKHFCNECGAANRSASKFCTVCGKPLSIYAGKVQSAATGLLTNTTLLKQRYRIRHKLGQGGFSAVYFAEDIVFNAAPRAVKEMSTQSASSQPLDQKELQQAIEALKQEALLLAGLTHPNLPRIYDHFEEQRRWYIVMDYIDGQTLETLLSTAPGGKLELSPVLHIANQLCTVLNYLHTRQPPIIFRDLKPANIMLTEDQHVYLIDFGIARLFKPGQAKDTIMLGSPGYAAPEQYGRAQSTALADIYSLGATLHHLLSGRDPSDDPFQFPPLALDQYVAGPGLAALIQRMVSSQKDQRPASIQQIKQELQKLPSLSGTSPSLQTREQQQKEQWLHLGDDHAKAGRHTEALEAYEQAIRLNPNDALAYYGKGQSLNELKRYEEALSACEQAIRLDPNLALAYCSKGYALWGLKRYKEALSACEQAIRLDPSLALAYCNKGYALCGLKRYKEALSACEQAIRLDPGLAHAYSVKGAALSNLERYREALSACEQAIRLDPSLALAYNNRGSVLWKLKRYEESLSACEQAIRLDPSLAQAYSNKGLALWQLKRYEEALSACEQTIRLDPSLALAYNNKGTILFELGWYEEALSACEQAIRLDPSLAQAYSNKGLALWKLKRYEEALSACEQAIRLDPKDAIMYSNKGSVLYELGWYEEALSAFEQATRLDPTRALDAILKGSILCELGRYREALSAFDQVIRLDPNLAPQTYFSKGGILRKLGLYKEALNAYIEAVRLDPSLAPQMCFSKGEILRELGRYQEALVAYNQAIRLDPSLAQAYEGINDVLQQLKWRIMVQQIDDIKRRLRDNR